MCGGTKGFALLLDQRNTRGKNKEKRVIKTVATQTPNQSLTVLSALKIIDNCLQRLYGNAVIRMNETITKAALLPRRESHEDTYGN